MAEETEVDETVDSPEGNNGDTDVEETHTSDTTSTEPDIDALLTQLETVKDKIPAEKLLFLNKDLQAGFTRRLNLLNKGASTAVDTITREAGVKIPEGKSALDLLTENEGRDFFQLIRGQVAEELKPMAELAANQKASANIREMIGFAVEQFPEVKENIQDVVRVIDSDNDLTELGKAFDGKALPYVMRGVAASIKVQKLETEVKRLNEIVKKASVTKAVGAQSSSAGGNRPGGEEPPKGKGRLEWAIQKGMEKLEQEAN